MTVNEIFSDNIAKNLKPVLKTDKLSGLKISGFISTPDLIRSSKKNYHIYINSRTVKCPVFQKAIDMAYRHTLGIGKYPFVVLNLELPTSDLDVNVHPTKREVRYKNTNQIFNFIHSAIDMALANNSFTPPPSPVITSHPQPVAKTQNVLPFSPFTESYVENGEEFKAVSDEDIFRGREREHRETPIAQTMRLFEPLENVTVADEEEHIIGQYKNTYILIETDEGLEIVDQHIAEERTIYEKLKSEKEVVSQIMFISDVLDVSASEAELLRENREKLEKFGYEIIFMNDSQISFKKIPQMISNLKPEELLSDILENLSGDLTGLEDRILIMTSCKASVKAGQKLNAWQMLQIIKKWRKCKQPYTCPHGRPISRVIKHKEIASFFERQS